MTVSAGAFWISGKPRSAAAYLKMHSGIPVLQVPDGNVLAYGTPDVWADVAT
jgi:hypothetical protein